MVDADAVGAAVAAAAVPNATMAADVEVRIHERMVVRE